MATAANPVAGGPNAPAPASFLLERGLLTADQVAQLLHAVTVTGRSFEALALERRLVDEATLAAAARDYAAAQVDERQPPLRVAPRAAEPSPQAEAVVEFALAALLANGTALEFETHATHEAAWSRARSLATTLAVAGDEEWQQLGHALVRPGAVLGFDVRPRAPRR